MKIYQGINSLTLTVELKSGMFHTESIPNSSTATITELLNSLMSKCADYAESVNDSLLDTEILVSVDDIDINALMDDVNLQSISSPYIPS